MPDLAHLRSDLEEEHGLLDHIVSSLSAAQWNAETPAEGWTVRDQISHLAFFDEEGTKAVADPEGFSAALEAIARDPVSYMQDPLDKGRSLPVEAVLSWWREAR